jgi:phospholipase A1
MYFVVGGADDESGDVTARFQLSFKYRIFDPESFVARWFTQADSFYFAYTPTSLWNWSADSAPFEDTTYRPSLFWQGVTSGRGLVTEVWRLGFEHASNGQGEENSRSLNTLFLRPVWATEIAGREFVFAPKLYAYLEKSDNPDIGEYRGNIEWIFRYGSETSWLVAAEIRGSSTDKGSIGLSLSYPIRAPVFYRAGGFIYAQYFQGYGESLLEYNIEKEPTLRIGFAIVR